MTDDTHWPVDVPSPLDYAFMAYTMDTSDERVRLQFLDKFGNIPAHIVRYAGMKWAGPINSQPARQTQKGDVT